MYCIHCGANLPDKAKFCIRCGQSQDYVSSIPTSEANEQHNDNNNQDKTINVNANYSFNSSEDLIDGKTRSKKNNNQNKIGNENNSKKFWKILIIIIIICLVIKLLSNCGNNANKIDSEELAADIQEAETTTESIITQDPTAIPELSVEEPKHVFFVELANNGTEYEGKLIETTVPVDYIYYDGDIEVDDDNGGKNICICTGDENIYNKKDVIKYATVEGRVSLSNGDIEINEVELKSTSVTAPEDYSAELREFEAAVVRGKIAFREDYIASAQKVSYEDLSRYPDTYHDEPVVISVYVKEVKTDGWLSAGAVSATLNGNEIIIYDNRECREPRLQAGDYITIYGDGYGLTKVKTYIKGTGILGSDLGADVIDERQVPAIQMKYTANDDVSLFDLEKSSYVYDNISNYEYYLIGVDIPN